MNEQNNYQQPVEQNYQQPAPQYQQPYGQQFYGPVRQLNTRRGLLKLILLSIITFGIYPFVFFSGISEDINLIASRFDGKKTMHYCLMAFIIGPLTFGIGFIVWFHNLSSRMGNELARRGIAYSFGASDYCGYGTFWEALSLSDRLFICTSSQERLCFLLRIIMSEAEPIHINILYKHKQSQGAIFESPLIFYLLLNTAISSIWLYI